MSTDRPLIDYSHESTLVLCAADTCDWRRLVYGPDHQRRGWQVGREHYDTCAERVSRSGAGRSAWEQIVAAGDEGLRFAQRTPHLVALLDAGYIDGDDHARYWATGREMPPGQVRAWPRTAGLVLCSVEGCDSEVHKQALCTRHYWRQRRAVPWGRTAEQGSQVHRRRSAQPTGQGRRRAEAS